MVNKLQNRPEPQRVWWIDRREHWRQRILCALLRAGFDARAWSTFEYPPVDAPPDQVPDLVILSGTRIDEEEKDLAQRILELGHPLLVVSGRVPIRLMRAIFSAGARDVIEAPPDLEQMVALVHESLDDLEPVSNYEAWAKAH